MTELLLKITKGPCCPVCGEDGFDDWHLSPGIRSYHGIIRGALRCHGCGKFFSITHYPDGETHSSIRARRRAQQ